MLIHSSSDLGSASSYILYLDVLGGAHFKEPFYEVEMIKPASVKHRSTPVDMLGFDVIGSTRFEEPIYHVAMSIHASSFQWSPAAAILGSYEGRDSVCEERHRIRPDFLLHRVAQAAVRVEALLCQPRARAHKVFYGLINLGLHVFLICFSLSL